MLHLERKKNQGIVVEIDGKKVEFFVSEISGKKVRLSFEEFHKEITVLRDELYWGEK